jgi:sugar diacid utilization regulator
VRASLARAVERLKAQMPPRHVVTTVRSDHALVLTSARELATGQGPLPLARRLREVAADAFGEEPHGWEVCVGIGEVRESLSEAANSYREAKRAAELAGLLPEFGQVVPWSQLGIYKLLAELPREYLSRSQMHPGLVKLFEHKDGQVLVETLECFLDLAGDVKETSARLVIHRATLYYRLAHIEEIAEVSMRDGEDRLAVHLGLKLARLGGFHPSQATRF